jgi:3-methyladenine DNA glycosylase AlkD
MSIIIENIRKELKLKSDEKTKVSGEHFFKEKVTLYGVKSSLVSLIAREHFKSINETDKHEVFGLCIELWESGIMEESFIACHWSFYLRKKYIQEDILVFENWVSKYVSNWASCDTLCNHTVGSVVEMYPENLSVLKKWAESENRWMRRASAVSLIVPARKGLFLNDIFEIALILLQDKDDMVQKGYGWMLKVASQKHLEKVFNFVIDHKNVMPRTALRYAIEKMPVDMKKRAMDRSS